LYTIICIFIAIISISVFEVWRFEKNQTTIIIAIIENVEMSSIQINMIRILCEMDPIITHIYRFLVVKTNI